MFDTASKENGVFSITCSLSLRGCNGFEINKSGSSFHGHLDPAWGLLKLLDPLVWSRSGDTCPLFLQCLGLLVITVYCHGISDIHEMKSVSNMASQFFVSTFSPLHLCIHQILRRWTCALTVHHDLLKLHLIMGTFQRTDRTHSVHHNSHLPIWIISLSI